ncbi:MAG: hypothetical protein ACHQ4G_02555 [Opitutales bacterium]
MKIAPVRVQTVLGQPSWRLASDKVEAFVTRRGGHLAPVTFQTEAGPIQPFAIAPWCGETLPKGLPGVLRPLRGDFFCLPFGSDAKPWRGERHPAHGETAEGPWRLNRRESASMHLVAEMTTTVRPGRVVKRILLRPGETNLYIRHELHGLRGPMSLGHHATLAFPDEPGAGRIAVSPWRFAQVCPEQFEFPAQGGYSSLKIGAHFRDLRRVPRATGGTADLTRYPAREGFEDLVMLSARAGSGPAWTAVTFPSRHYVWFALKDPRKLASTVLWHSNGGRHGAPWSGRHRRVLGLEEVTSYFHLGLAKSAAPNPVARRGIPTVLHLDPARPLTVPYIMGVAAIPRGFDTVRRIDFHDDHIVLRAASGPTLRHAVDVSFLHPVTL